MYIDTSSHTLVNQKLQIPQHPQAQKSVASGQIFLCHQQDMVLAEYRHP